MLGYGPGQPCPAVSPPPDGYRVWNESKDGTPPPAAVALAAKLAFNSYELGYSEAVCIADEPLIVRVDPHTWTHDAQGHIIWGCFHGATVYRPLTPGSCNMAEESTGTKALHIVEATVLASAIFGAAFAVGKTFFEHKHAREMHEDNVRAKLQQQYATNPYTPYATSWPVYEYRITPSWYSMSRKRSGGSPVEWLIMEMQKLPTQTPRSSVVGGDQQRHVAITKAMEYAQKRRVQDRQNPNKVRVLDETGECIYSV